MVVPKWLQLDRIQTKCSTAQGGGEVSKTGNLWKPIGEVGCCESWMAERTQWCVPVHLSILSICFSIYVYIYIHITNHNCVSISINIYIYIYKQYIYIYISICFSIYLPIHVCINLSICLSIYLFYVKIHIDLFRESQLLISSQSSSEKERVMAKLQELKENQAGMQTGGT